MEGFELAENINIFVTKVTPLGKYQIYACGEHWVLHLDPSRSMSLEPKTMNKDIFVEVIIEGKKELESPSAFFVLSGDKLRIIHRKIRKYLYQKTDVRNISFYFEDLRDMQMEIRFYERIPHRGNTSPEKRQSKDS